ncbi:hypothetical protein GWK26_08515 [haloarchaeon 3A1-DGR]|nr:hypothetical protein GWK26_08515 [haloarchaeon 3A1-DGR]
MSTTTPQRDFETFEDPTDRLQDDAELCDLFHRIARSDADSAERFERALKKAGCWNDA